MRRETRRPPARPQEANQAGSRSTSAGLALALNRHSQRKPTALGRPRLSLALRNEVEGRDRIASSRPSKARSLEMPCKGGKVQLGAGHLRSSAAHILSASNSSSVILVTVPAPTGAGAFDAERY